MCVLDLLQMILFLQRNLSFFLKFNFKSAYMPGFYPPDKFLYEITVILPTELEQ